MKPKHVSKFEKILSERFGDALTEHQGVPSSDKKKDMGNRGFGSKLESLNHNCEVCRGSGLSDVWNEETMSYDEDACFSCRGTGYDEEGWEDASLDELDQVAPPGDEKLVKKLKKQPGVKNPWALAWSIHNKKKGVKEGAYRLSPVEVGQTWEDLYIEMGSVPLEVLSSWLSAPDELVKRSLPTYLTIDQNGNVVEKGLH